MNLTRALFAGALMVATLASCTSQAKKPEEVDANGKKIEYVYYTPTGSNVPIRVRKDELQTSESDTNAQQKVFSDLQRKSAADQSPSTGGR